MELIAVGALGRHHPTTMKGRLSNQNGNFVYRLWYFDVLLYPFLGGPRLIEPYKFQRAAALLKGLTLPSHSGEDQVSCTTEPKIIPTIAGTLFSYK